MKQILALFCLLFLTTAALAQDAGNAKRPRNLKVLNEYPDGKGHIVRVVQFDEGTMRVTQTIIMDKPLGSGHLLPVSLDTLDKRYLEILINKSDYTVKVLYRRKPIRSYRAVFGPRPKDDKRCEGDRCTPEGTFTITNKNPGSKYTRFLGLNYPNDSSYARFNRLKKSGQLPAGASIGGNIGIHGVWAGGDDLIELGVGWTDGCIALKNKDIEELFSLIDVGTKVMIKK